MDVVRQIGADYGWDPEGTPGFEANRYSDADFFLALAVGFYCPWHNE